MLCLAVVECQLKLSKLFFDLSLFIRKSIELALDLFAHALKHLYLIFLVDQALRLLDDLQQECRGLSFLLRLPVQGL